MLAFTERIVREKFMHGTIRGKFAVARAVPEIFPLIEGWVKQPGDVKWYQTR